MITIDYTIPEVVPIEVEIEPNQKVAVTFAEAPTLDAFFRNRVSQLFTQADIKQLHDNQPLLLSIETIGTATDSHSTTNAKTTLTTAAVNDAAIIQTKQRYNYQSGKSQLIYGTYTNFDLQTNITKRMGYFNTSTVSPYTADIDGITIENDGSDYFVKTYRTGITTNSVPRASWDDPLDGTGASGLNIGTFANGGIWAIDFEWLGYGEIRYYFIYERQIINFHTIWNASKNSEVYMSSPNHSIRYEIRQTGAGIGAFAGTCMSANSEGSQNTLGKVLSDNAGTNDIQCNTAGTRYATIGIRLKSTHLDAVIDILEFDYLAETNDRALWELVLNPTLSGGGGPFNYSDVANDAVQIAIGNQTGGQAPIITAGTGTTLASGYLTQADSVRIPVDSPIKLGAEIDGTRDEIVLVITPIQAGLDCFVSYTWRNNV